MVKEKTHNRVERHSVDPIDWYIKSRKKIQIHSTKFSDLQNETVYEDMATLVFLLVLSAWLVQVQHTNIQYQAIIPISYRSHLERRNMTGRTENGFSLHQRHLSVK